jgi:hypothetical protein
MATWNYSSSALSSVQAGTGFQLLNEEIAPLLAAGIDEAMNLYAETPQEGVKYYKVKNVSGNNYKSQEMLGIGLMKLNSDGEQLPVDKQIVGFPQTIVNYVLRQAMGITRETLETDRYGVIGDHSRALMHSANRTLEYIYADAFNRGIGTTGLALLCEDGMAMFSASHVNPRASAGTWSNYDSGGVLTAAAVAAHRTAFKTYEDGNGDLSPQMLQKVIVAPNLEDTMREISGSTLKVDTSLNNTNVVSGTAYECWSWLKDGMAIFEGDGDNGLELHVRKNPEITSFNDGTNPDKLWSRVRMAVGTGCKRPGKWRATLVS